MHCCRPVRCSAGRWHAACSHTRFPNAQSCEVPCKHFGQNPLRYRVITTVCKHELRPQTLVGNVFKAFADDVGRKLGIIWPGIADEASLAAPALEENVSGSVPGTLPPLPTEFPPLPPLKLPDYVKVTLDNGLHVFLLEDHEVPLVRGSLLMHGGQYASPADKVGIATITAGVQRSGGSVQHPQQVLNDRLEELAAAIESGAGPQAVSVDFQCMKEDLSEVFGLFSEVVRTPLLPESKLSLFKAQIFNVLDHQNDKGSLVARRMLQQQIYGRDSIYARRPSKAQIASLTVEDMRNYIAMWERPDTAVLGVLGDFNADAMLEMVRQHFGDWSPAEGQPATAPPVPRATIHAQTNAGNVLLVDRPGDTQASVSVGEPGISLLDPDAYALDVLGGIFNSFGGQLFDEIRSRKSLAYSVSGGWDTPPEHQGVFVGGGETSLPAEFLTELRKVLAKATEAPPDAQELITAKAEALNTFVFNFASTASQLQRILVYDLLGLPQDFLFSYNNGIAAVTADDVLEAARRHLHPQQQTTVIAADASKVQRSLEEAGFNIIPLELPPN